MEDPRDADDVDGVDAKAAERAGPTVASVPFMITRAQRAALRQAGASDDDIRSMKPDEVERFLDRHR
ncbi:MAG: hypothetical protein Q8Q62_17505 [Mesorhizobium sp.]|nr:hypothetical protein [Mesorhizobium sp.]